MKPPLISCIVPVFNGERYLGETLDSILAQTYRPLEIIVIDDGSTDGTRAVANRYGSSIRYLCQANAGEAAARDHGLKVAQGELIAFLDADDLWHPQKLTLQSARLCERPEIDLCFTHFRNFWVPELAEEEHRFQTHPLSRLQSGWSISTLLAHRTTFEKFGNFGDTDCGLRTESMIWYLRVAERRGVIEVLPEVLMYRRLHASNVSRNVSLEPFLSILKEWRDYQRRKTTEQ